MIKGPAKQPQNKDKSGLNFPFSQCPCNYTVLTLTLPLSSYSPCPVPRASKRKESSERVILGRYLVGEELVENGNLLHDVVAYLGYLGEEEEGEEASYTAETGGEDTVLGGLVEGHAVVVLGDGVSVVGEMLLA